MSERDERDRAPATEHAAGEAAERPADAVAPSNVDDELDEEALAVLAEANERTSGAESVAVADDDEHEPSSASAPARLDEVDVRALLRAALRTPPRGGAPDLLGGVQRRLRVRSRGKFYGDGWSTARAPRSTYLVTSLLMLLVLVLVYVVLIPWVGTALP